MRRPFSLVVLLAVAMTCRAHDYWIEPETFFPEAGKPLAVRLFVGDGFKSEEERPFQKKATVHFRWLHGGKDDDLTDGAEDDRKPVARLTPKHAGTHLLAMERGPRLITLEAAKFTAYLEEEGLAGVVEQRRKAGEDKAPGRERYTRYLKSLFQVGDRPAGDVTKPLGHKLEIVPAANPCGLKTGDRLTVRVLFDGKPLAGVRLFAHRRAGDKVTTEKLTTSKDGEASFAVAEGAWLVRLVHMRRAEGDKEADWESFWTSLSFALRTQ